MPIINSSYKPPFFLGKSAQFQTIFPSIFRKLKSSFKRERITMPDDDFLDLDWLKHCNNELIVIGLHGLESSALAPYIANMLVYFYENGWDAVSINCRSCSGELNKKPYSYHSGYTGDLRFIIEKIISENQYKTIVLVGCSMGGNVVLKYLGECENDIHPTIKTAFCVSVPYSLGDCGDELAKWYNRHFLQNFMIPMKQKIKEKSIAYPNKINWEAVKNTKNFFELDTAFTAPINGFKDANDYYEKASCGKFLSKIKIPFFILNAKDDPFLTSSSYPYDEAKVNPYFYLETPENGGHIGFIEFSENGYYYHDKRCFEFVQQILSAQSN